MKIGAILVLGFGLLAQEKPATGGWKNVTAGVGGETWGYAGVTLLAAVPDRDEIIAGVSEQGLWSSADGGATWKSSARRTASRSSTGPTDRVRSEEPRTFWVSGCYGAGIFRTTDGGGAFPRLGKARSRRRRGVDFQRSRPEDAADRPPRADPEPHASFDGGEKWEKIGDRLPEDSNFSTGSDHPDEDVRGQRLGMDEGQGVGHLPELDAGRPGRRFPTAARAAAR
jgi:hypothetical protein